MDSNKRDALKAAGYRILPCCGLCSYARLSPDGWGTCDLLSYEHRKHTGPPRQASISAYGRCPRFCLATTKFRKLHGFIEFWGGADA